MAKVLGDSRAQSPSMAYLARCSLMLLHFPPPHSQAGGSLAQGSPHLSHSRPSAGSVQAVRARVQGWQWEPGRG